MGMGTLDTATGVSRLQYSTGTFYEIYQICFVCPVCVSVLLSHTVLSELYQEKLVTEDEVEKMKGEEWYLSYRLVRVQCTKPPEVVTRTTDVLHKYGFDEEARQLRGW